MTSKTDGTTHADGCYRWGPRHYDCAVREIERLERELADYRSLDTPTAGPICRVINNNQPGWTMIVETAPNVTISVGEPLYERADVDRLIAALGGAIHRAETAERELAEARADIERAIANHSADLSAERASAEPSGWMPIESAPKDGSWFLAHRAHSVLPLIVRWDTAYDAAEDAFGDHVYHLTHWMPLPPPPADQPEGER